MPGAGSTTGHASSADFDRVLVVDFGAQYAQLIARRVREAHVYSEIVPRQITAAEVKARKPAAIILSGGPVSVYASDGYEIDRGILELGIPTLGICYGHQVLAYALDGKVVRNDAAEYGRTALTVSEAGVLFDDQPSE
jgi:GMP synthase (glutamine-hydrolysing)